MATMNSGLGGPAGYGENVFSGSTKAVGGDDDGAVQVDVTSVFGGGGISAFGANYTDIYINSNGAITFGTPAATFDSNGLDDFTMPALAPFYSDINITSAGEIYWDVDPGNGKITITWDGVAPYSGTGTNSFQVVLTDTGGGKFDVEYIYEDIQWGDSGGNPAVAGVTDGADYDAELDGSGDSSTMQAYESNDFGNGTNGTFSQSFANGYPEDGILTGSSGDDTIDGSFTDEDGEVVDGGDGSGPSGQGDQIHAGAGQDTVAAGQGDDTIYGGGGDDTLDGGDGDDTIFGDTDPNPDGGAVSINASNFADTSSGYNVTAQNVVSGSLTTASASNIGTFNGTFGASGAVSDSDSGVDQQTGYDKASGISETVIVDFDDSIDALSFSYWSLQTGSHGEVGHYAIYDDGTLIYETDFTDSSGTGSDTIDVSGHGNFDQIVFTAKLQTDGSDGSDFGLTDITFTPNDVASQPGDDIITGGAGNDTIYGEEGDDTISGGSGDDTISGGSGDDTITGGDGDDTFTYAAGDGHDTITDFNFGNSGTLDDGDAGNNDFIDLSGFYDDLDELYADQADDGILNQSNDGVDGVNYADNTQFGPDDSLTFQGASADETSFTTENTGVAAAVCFTSGTAIRTPRGDVLIDELKVGDLVTTLDNGPQRIRWIGRRTLGPKTLRDNPNLRPILLNQSVLGCERPLLVSPQHGMLVGRQGDHLVRAKHLAETMRGVRIAHGKRQVTYIHLMFEAHQIILAEATPSESFYPGPTALQMIDGVRRGELFDIFPELKNVRNDRAELQKSFGITSRSFIAKKQLVSVLRNLCTA